MTGLPDLVIAEFLLRLVLEEQRRRPLNYCLYCLFTVCDSALRCHGLGRVCSLRLGAENRARPTSQHAAAAREAARLPNHKGGRFGKEV
ncbi:hypothetical protein DPEC_G00361890 [Dallia pectoralis]|nr:hypothetical protein DPEC_G00361890 [Dallia pectoralis]